MWARIANARYEAWTPEGDLLVSRPNNGTVSQLSPGSDPSAPPQQRVLLAGLTQPQGLAFDSWHGQPVLYVIESDRLDRYPWSAAGPGPTPRSSTTCPTSSPAGTTCTA